MNTKPVLLGSLALNLAALAAVGYLLTQRPATPPPVTAPPVKQTTPATRIEKKVITQTVTNEMVKQIDWRAVESDDYKKYIANLRAIGCPEETIKDIIVADVNKLFDARRKEASKDKKKFEFWKSGNPFEDFMNPELLEKNQALARERRAMLKELLGYEPEEKQDIFAALTGGANPFEQMLDFLPASKQAQVMELFSQYQAKAMKAMGKGAPDAEDLKAMQKIKKEGEAELAKLLTPQEKEQFDLIMSDTANMMRFQSAGFDYTEQEFRDIFKLRKAFDDEFGDRFGGGSLDKDERAKRDSAQKQTDEGLKTLLGEQRFTEYKRSQDWEYQNIAKVAEREALPKEASVKVYDMKKVAEEQAQKLRMDKSLSNEARASALQAIRAETERSVIETLGQKGFDRYKNNAYWLRNISPDPKPAKP
jgi:hypothetical protein